MRSHVFQHGLVLGVALQFLLSELAQCTQSGALVFLREYNVEADDAHLVMVEQLVEHRTELVAAPRPAAFGRQAFLVDVDDHDPRIDVAGHRQAQTRVINDVFEAIDERDLVIATGVAGKSKDHYEPERDAHQVLLQAASLVVLRAGSALRTRLARWLLEFTSRAIQRTADCQGFRKNSIFTPGQFDDVVIAQLMCLAVECFFR